MAKIILKCPYLKPDAKTDTGGYVYYIATRSGVQMPGDSKLLLSATHKQAETAESLVLAYPDLKELHEYADYVKEPNRGNAIDFMCRAADVHPELVMDRSGYAYYIATRSGAALLQQHGLFTDAGVPVILDRVAKEISDHTGNIWCHIISLRREDAARLGYDNVGAWQNLLRAKRNEVAKAMKIRPDHFRWYAAYHDEGHHPHVHMVCYSVDPKEAWLSKSGIAEMKKEFAAQIFRQDLISIYDKQTDHRDALRNESTERIRETIARIQQEGYANAEVDRLLIELSRRLRNTSGKKVYGYLKADVKAIVDRIVDELAKDERVVALYDAWYEQREQIISVYTDEFPERIPLSQNKEFKTIKNAVIREAESLVADEDREYVMRGTVRKTSITPGKNFENSTENKNAYAGSAALGSFRLLGRICDLIRENIDESKDRLVDRKEWKQIDEKKKAQGLRM